jgi:hypothetical protein
MSAVETVCASPTSLRARRVHHRHACRPGTGCACCLMLQKRTVRSVRNVCVPAVAHKQLRSNNEVKCCNMWLLVQWSPPEVPATQARHERRARGVRGHVNNERGPGTIRAAGDVHHAHSIRHAKHVKTFTAPRCAVRVVRVSLPTAGRPLVLRRVFESAHLHMPGSKLLYRRLARYRLAKCEWLCGSERCVWAWSVAAGTGFNAAAS